jgi:hypothetical protein
VTSVATDSHGVQTVTAESGAGNFFSPSSMGLVDALVKHGVDADIARDIEAEIEPGEALVTVETGDRDPQEAIAILELSGGRVEASDSNGFARETRPGDRSESAPSVSDDSLDVPVWEEEIFYVRGRR